MIKLVLHSTAIRQVSVSSPGFDVTLDESMDLLVVTGESHTGTAVFDITGIAHGHPLKVLEISLFDSDRTEELMQAATYEIYDQNWREENPDTFIQTLNYIIFMDGEMVLNNV